jgi:hypothetical protein
VEILRTYRAKGRLVVAAFAAVTMLAAPLALLNSGAASSAATARTDGGGSVATAPTTLGATQLVASDVPASRSTSTPRRTVPETRARHEAAVKANHALREHDLAVARNHVIWQHDRAVAANQALHAQEVADQAAARSEQASAAAHAQAVAVERQAQAVRDAAQQAAASRAETKPVSAPTRATERPTVPVVSYGQSRVGAATWYAWNAGQCASPFLPHGTMLTVTDLATGKSIQCLVTDTEADNVGRVVDLSEYCFEELGSLSQGVIEVRVSW